MEKTRIHRQYGNRSERILAMIEKIEDITGDDTQRANRIIIAIDNGETITADDAEFYAQYTAAYALHETEMQAKLDAINLQAETMATECEKMFKNARTGYNKLVNAALARYERVRGEVNE